MYVCMHVATVYAYHFGPISSL